MKQEERDGALPIAELIQIKNALEQLAKSKSELGYQWAKNLNKVLPVIKSADEAFEASRDSLLEKDEEGKNIEYVGRVEVIGNTQVANIIKDQNGVKRRLKRGENLEFPETIVAAVPDDQMETWKKIQEDYNKDLHKIDWHTIPESRIKEVAAREKIEGIYLVPLFDKIIIPDEKSKVA